MKHIHTLLAFLISTAAGAQLVNGSFEADGAADLSGWSSTCGTMSSSPDVPGETGNWSIRLEQVDHWTCTHDYVYQYLPFAHCGDVWELGVWARTDPSAQLGMSISFMTRDGGVWGEYEGGMGTDQPDWSHAVSTFGIWCDAGDSVFLVLDAGNMFPDSTYGSVWFDEITLVPISTGDGTSDPVQRPAFRPNPATDKLWVDLRDVPLSINAIDASGRTHDLRNFTHRDQTLEVDVDVLPAGICLLRITTASGTHTVRFVKA
ncbi:MAG: T9SS type A sorting domain-containing protein [Flavobacteriales bacterium]|nr:T9SS type A sorting domain-containing protein [Flavobacteriales bacterium]